MLTAVENEREGVQEALAALFPHTGAAQVIGVTGAPGTGKSTLVGALARGYRRRGQTVGILAIDPTSPFTGGAILGDRIRMSELAGDSGVFIRSMATRGQLGGLARATADAVRVLDAAGFQIVIVETVGAGQSEVDIAQTAQTTLVVEAPGLGDDVQAIKAGILEIADILVVNKADKPGAENTVRALKAMLELGHPAARHDMPRHHGQLLQRQPEPEAGQASHELWMPPVIRTVATTGDGIDDVIEAIDEHRRYLERDNLLARIERRRLEAELHHRLREALIARLLESVPEQALSAMIERIQARQITPHHAVNKLLDEAG
nr:MAG: methylmalonyl Co-A mutase-associated GTPase MeaB [Chloroflexota bacterium]